MTRPNHIICGHYDAAYGCGKCLDKVTVLGQQMSYHFKHCKGLKEKSAGPRKVGDDVAGPSGDAVAGRSRDQPKKKKKKMKSCEKSPEMLPPTGSVVSPCRSAHHHREATCRSRGSESQNKESHEKWETLFQAWKGLWGEGHQEVQGHTQEGHAIEGYPTEGEDPWQGQN